ncbi:MAG: hypothetical protein P4M11_15995 [Candidatus Pacebacteria bacterium]|nr:hypothetical protein [Candidatus Paceibacterota bacterium]
MYVETALSQTADLFQSAALDYFTYNLSVQKALFICYVIFALIVFFCVIQLLIMGLNTNIWRAKRLLALYPTHKIAENLDVFKQVIGALT